MVKILSGFQGLHAEHAFAVDIGPVRAAQIAQDELVFLLEQLTMTAADLR